mgnify:CR=1 FL=1
MYENHNNPSAISKTNTEGLDKSRRIVEFYPYQDSSYDAIEDDGISMTQNSDGTVDYGSNGEDTLYFKCKRYNSNIDRKQI